MTITVARTLFDLFCIVVGFVIGVVARRTTTKMEAHALATEVVNELIMQGKKKGEEDVIVDRPVLDKAMKEAFVKKFIGKE